MNETDATKALAYAEGYLTALAAVLQDREWVDGKTGNITVTTAEVKKILRDVGKHGEWASKELKSMTDENTRLLNEIERLESVITEQEKMLDPAERRDVIAAGR